MKHHDGRGTLVPRITVMKAQTLDLDELTGSLGIGHLQVMAVEVRGKKYHQNQTYQNQ